MMTRLLLGCSLLYTVTAHALDFDTKAMVTAHNRWRAEVGVPPLSYSSKLAASARRWANVLKTTNHCQMHHSKGKGYGENLYWASAIKWSDGRHEIQHAKPDQVVNNWASERANYSHASNGCAPGKVCGHYTQLVWRTTRKVGCAAQVCEDSHEQIWVCQHQPPGNWAGKKPY
jgi:pathogenesis-related protein 1